MEPTDPPDPITDPLGSLRWHWGSAYDIRNPAARVWIGERRDTHATLRADSPLALRDAIVADYAARPVPRPAPKDDEQDATEADTDTCRRLRPIQEL